MTTAPLHSVPANSSLASRLWSLIQEMDEAGEMVAANHATMAWSILKREPMSSADDS